MPIENTWQKEHLIRDKKIDNFFNVKSLIESVANILLKITSPTPTTSRFIRTMVVVGCCVLALLIGTACYSRAVSHIRRAEQLAVLEKQRQEQQAKEELARQEHATKVQQAKEATERKRKEESARQMLSGSRFVEGTFGASCLPPKGWQRTRDATDAMSVWIGSGYPIKPNMNFRFLRHTSSLESAVENGFSGAQNAFSEIGATAKSLGTTEFTTTSGKNGVKLLIEAPTTQATFREALYYIENGDMLFCATCTASESKWSELEPMFDACMKSIEFSSRNTASTFSASDTTPEQNADTTDANTLLNIGVTYYYDGNHAKAVSFFRKSADIGQGFRQERL